jgi:hypothetical protein
MSDPVPAPLEAMPLPFGVQKETGATRPPLTPDELGARQSDRDPAEVKARASTQRTLALVPGMDPMKLQQAGWGVVFASDIDPAIRSAIQPLLDHREKQVANPKRFKVFEGNKGVRPNQSAVDWLDRQGVGLAVVDPRQGVPYYLMLVGSPCQISFEFQFLLDTQWCVGRLHFDTPAQYEAYARSVVDYETVATVPNRKRAAMWMARNPGDGATGMLYNQVGARFQKEPLGADDGWEWTAHLDADATKQQLQDVLGSRPAVLFTGSHGLEWPMSDPAGQRANQGALITQEWTPGNPVTPPCMYSAADLGSTNVQGMICFLFACFGGGWPTADTYRSDPSGSPIAIAEEPAIARLPQQLLANGALGVMAHVDRAWSYSFQTGSGLPQNQVLRSTIECAMGGARAGQAADYFNLQWATLAALLGIQQRQRTPAQLGNLYIARDDARNYALLGDPAVRVRTEALQA